MLSGIAWLYWKLLLKIPQFVYLLISSSGHYTPFLAFWKTLFRPKICQVSVGFLGWNVQNKVSHYTEFLHHADWNLTMQLLLFWFWNIKLNSKNKMKASCNVFWKAAVMPTHGSVGSTVASKQVRGSRPNMTLSVVNTMYCLQLKLLWHKIV